MKKFDFIWIAVLALIGTFLIYPDTHVIFLAATKAHPYIMGFVKVFILATMGELLAIRIMSGQWKKPFGLLYRAIIWGFFGMTFVVVFDIFAIGMSGVMEKGLMPFYENTFAFALFTSTFLNLIFAPTFMAFHRITDTYIDMGQGKLSDIFSVKLDQVISKIDWNNFISFVVLKTIPLFWIPAHTITFMLPSEYRVLMAAFLSIALGGILSFAKKKNTKNS
jgi:hypothetical protein